MTQSEKHHNDHLKEMYKQVRKLDLGLLLSGLTILVKDTASFLTDNGVDSARAEAFRFAYLAMLSENRYYWERFGPNLYCSLEDADLPGGFAKSSANCEAVLQPLSEDKLEKEWLRAPAWFFFQSYSGQRRNDILAGISLETLKAAYCDGVSPYEGDADSESRHGESDRQFKFVEALVKRLSEDDREFNAYWYPVMLYIAILLYKTNFITLE